MSVSMTYSGTSAKGGSSTRRLPGVEKSSEGMVVDRLDE
jgi:hypothetical protein